MHITTTILLILTFLPLVVVMQISYHKMKMQHQKKIKTLRNKSARLLQKQNELKTQMIVLDSFENYYQNRQQDIANAILDLQFELFKQCNQNNV